MYEGNKPSLLHNGTDYFGYLRYLLLYMYLTVLAIVRTDPPDLSVFNYNVPFFNTRLSLQVHHKGAYYFQIDQACQPVLTNNGIIWFNKIEWTSWPVLTKCWAPLSLNFIWNTIMYSWQVVRSVNRAYDDPLKSWDVLHQGHNKLWVLTKPTFFCNSCYEQGAILHDCFVITVHGHPELKSSLNTDNN